MSFLRFITHQLTFLINKIDEVYGTEHSYSSYCRALVVIPVFS